MRSRKACKCYVVFAIVVVASYLLTILYVHFYRHSLSYFEYQFDDHCSNETSTDLQEIEYEFSYRQARSVHVDHMEWQYTQPLMTTSERRTLRELLTIFVQVCDTKNFTYFLISGSLLGSYQHHNILPWDDDVDILMRRSERMKIFTAFYREAAVSKTLGVGPGPGRRMKIFHKTEGSKVPLKKYKYRWPLLDITFFNENDTHVWQYNNSHVLPKSIVFPLHLRPFETIQLMSPHDAFAVLNLLYTNPNCVTLTWSHKLERSRRFIKFNCADLKMIYPYVFRRAANSSMEETLVLRECSLYSVHVDEPLYAVSQPFKLQLQEQ